MKLELRFRTEDVPKIVNWWNPIENFPPFVLFDGARWEFIMYQTDLTNRIDYICTFGQVYNYNPLWDKATFTNIDYLFESIPKDDCECGAKFTSFDNMHMYYCKKWTKL